MTTKPGPDPHPNNPIIARINTYRSTGAPTSSPYRWDVFSDNGRWWLDGGYCNVKSKNETEWDNKAESFLASHGWMLLDTFKYLGPDNVVFAPVEKIKEKGNVR